jgi:hypothetical protein
MTTLKNNQNYDIKIFVKNKWVRRNNFKKNQRDNIKDLLTITIENEWLQKFQFQKKSE